jgi:hypothetical protein
MRTVTTIQPFVGRTNIPIVNTEDSKTLAYLIAIHVLSWVLS